MTAPTGENPDHAHLKEAVRQLSWALHKALEWPLSDEDSDKCWAILEEYGEGPPECPICAAPDAP